MENMPKKIPHFDSDEEVEAFLEQDLSDYLPLVGGRKVKFVFEPVSKNLNLRVQPSLLNNLKKRAKKLKMPYQRYIRQILLQEMANPRL